MPNPLVTNVSPSHNLLGVEAAHVLELAHGHINVANVRESLNSIKYRSLLSKPQILSTTAVKH
jgi:hypothetical protein